MTIEKQLENYQSNRALIEAQIDSFRRNPLNIEAADNAETDTLSVVEVALHSSLRQLTSDLDAILQVQPPDRDAAE